MKGYRSQSSKVRTASLAHPHLLQEPHRLRLGPLQKDSRNSPSGGGTTVWLEGGLEDMFKDLSLSFRSVHDHSAIQGCQLQVWL